MHDVLKWLVIPGGPGMSNNYLQHTLPEAFPEYNLFFYHPYGSPESEKKEVTIETMVLQIEEAISNFFPSEEFGLITHSFGNYLALRLLEKNHSRLKALIMINPIPFTYTGWQSALQSIIKTIPEEILIQVNSLALQPDQGTNIFRLIYPYYLGNIEHTLPMNIPFDMDTCNLITSKIRNFNDIHLISNPNQPIIRIVGAKDPFYVEKEIMVDNTLVLNSVGHYPFFEYYAQFINKTQQVKELLCHLLRFSTTISG